MPAGVPEFHRVAVAALALGALLQACGAPPGGPPSPEGRSWQVFRDQVVPVLDARCGSCHGVPPGVVEGETMPPLRWPVDGAGRLATEAMQRAAFESIRRPTTRRGGTFAPLTRDGVALESPLLRSPLAAALSGVPDPFPPHPDVFPDLEDADFRSLRAWVSLELAADTVAPRRLEGEALRVFAEELTPVLVRKGCFLTNCHGRGSPGILLFRLDPGIPALPERFTPTIHARNRDEMRGLFTRNWNPHGDPERSLQLLKSIPLEDGGVIHRAGNDAFRKGDPDYRVMHRWIELEQEELRRATGAPLGELRGLVFVRRPRATPERFFEDGDFLPGGDLIWLRDGVETNLTAALHPEGPADVRAPDVSYDGTRVVFAMRRSAAGPFDLFEVELENGRARQLTFSEAPGVHFLDPLYVPDPDDHDGAELGRVALVFTSNRAGEWGQVSPEHLLGEAEGGTRSTLEDRQRTESPGALTGRSLQVLRGTNQGYVGRVARSRGAFLEVEPHFPEPADSTTHYLVSATPRFGPKYDAYRMRHAAPGAERETFEGTVRRLTFSPEQVRRPTMRSSGRYVYTALRTGWEKGRPFFNGGLWRSHLDGCDFKQHNGNRSVVPIHCDDRELVDGLEVRIGRDADSYWGGMLMLSDFRFGPSIETDNPLDAYDHPFGDVDGFYRNTRHPYASIRPASSLTRFVPGWITLDDQAQPGGRTARAYRDPYSLPDGGFLVARSAGPAFDLHDPSAAPDFDIVKVAPSPAWQASYGFRRRWRDPDGSGRQRRSQTVRPLNQQGFRRGPITVETVAGGPMSELWPRPVWVRAKEPVVKKLNPAAEVYGPPGRVQGWEGYPEGTPGVVVNYDQLILDLLGQSMLPAGVQHLAAARCPACGEVTPEDGRVEWVRLVGAVPRRPGETGPLRRFMIAEAPLARDGSFHLQLPSGMPFQIQSLNRQRMALRGSSRWRYLQPGEKHRLSFPRRIFSQACGSCHGGMTGNPADARRRVDAVTRASPFEAGWDMAAGRPRPPAKPWQAGSFQEVTFERNVGPLLERRCVGCHGGGAPAAGLDLGAGEASRRALRQLVETREMLSSKSFLIEKLVGRELGAPRSLGETARSELGGHHAGAPHPAEDPLGWEERLTFVRWIDLGAP